MVTLPDSPVGNQDVAELLRDGERVDDPMDVEFPPDPCAMPTDTLAGMPIGGPMLHGAAPGRRASGESEVRIP